MIFLRIKFPNCVFEGKIWHLVRTISVSSVYWSNVTFIYVTRTAEYYYYTNALVKPFTNSQKCGPQIVDMVGLGVRPSDRSDLLGTGLNVDSRN